MSELMGCVRMQAGAIPISHHPSLQLALDLQARFSKCAPRTSTVMKWDQWKKSVAHLWLRKQTSMDRPAFMRRYK